MDRKQYLDLAEETICRDRQNVHGSPESCFSAIADYWNTFLSHKLLTEIALTPSDVAIMMTLFKTARWQMNAKHVDNVVDALGYWALAGELGDGVPWDGKH